MCPIRWRDSRCEFEKTLVRSLQKSRRSSDSFICAHPSLYDLIPEMGFFSARTPQELLSSSFEKVVDEYLNFFASSSSHTARAKLIDLRDFLTFLAKHRKLKLEGALKVAHWDHSSVNAFVEALLDRGFAPASVARRLATLKHLGRTLAENIIGFVNPAKEAKAPKATLDKPKSLARSETESTVDLLTKSLGPKTKFDKVRAATLFQFILETGLRAEECRLLRKIQISEDLKWIKNVRTKGKKFRNVYVSSSLQPVLERYLECRALELRRFFPELKPNIDARLPVFISNYKANPNDVDSFLMGAKTLWRIINAQSKGQNLHPHLLRHSFAMNLLESSNDVRLVSQALGHSDVRVTMRYTQRRDEDVAEAVEKMSKARKADIRGGKR